MRKRIVDMTPDEKAAHEARVAQRQKDRAEYAARVAAQHQQTLQWRAQLNAIPIDKVREAQMVLADRRNAYIASEVERMASNLTAFLHAAGHKNVAADITAALRKVPQMEGFVSFVYTDGRTV